MLLQVENRLSITSARLQGLRDGKERLPKFPTPTGMHRAPIRASFLIPYLAPYEHRVSQDG